MEMRTIVLLLAPTVTPALAQSGEAAVYIDQFRTLQQKMEQIFSEVKSSGLPGVNTAKSIEIQERLFALTKLVHRLGETALSANNELLRDPKKDRDKSLMLVGQGCIAIDFVLTALDNYIDTGDRAFLGFATDAKQIVLAVGKIL
jgi:hypothetical protein